MSTLTIPQTFTGNVAIRGDKVQANFKAIADYLNGVSPGIDSANLGASFSLQASQLAESRCLSFLNVPFIIDAMLPRVPDDVNSPQTLDQYAWTHILREPTEIVAARLSIVKNNTSAGKAKMQVFTGDASNRTYKTGFTVYFDEAVPNTWGFVVSPPGYASKTFSAGTMVNVYPILTTTNVTGICLQLALATSLQVR